MNKEIMKTLGFDKEVEAVENGHCPSCGKEIRMEDFRSDIDRREHRISGLCQECQDEVFG